MQTHAVRIPVGNRLLDGDLTFPENATSGIVLFAHGSGSSRHSTRNRFVARVLNETGLATLLLDLLTPEEEREDMQTGHLRFDISLLADRLVAAIDWISAQKEISGLAVGIFGASTGGGAALVAAARVPDHIAAVVSRGGRPDLAGAALAGVKAPTLLIVGGDDIPVIGMNRDAERRMTAEREIRIVPGASHLFEEPGTLEAVAEHARDWFLQYLKGGEVR